MPLFLFIFHIVYHTPIHSITSIHLSVTIRRGLSTSPTAADPPNLRPQPSRLEIRKHFFSQRVVEGWNGTPADLKQAVNVKCFINGYRTFREKMVERTWNGWWRRSIKQLCVPQQSPDSLWAVLTGPWRLSFHVSMYVCILIACKLSGENLSVVPSQT